MYTRSQVENFFSTEKGYLEVNSSTHLMLESAQESCKFLCELLLHWQTFKIVDGSYDGLMGAIFCDGKGFQHFERDENPELVAVRGRWWEDRSQWEFSYKTPSGCGACYRSQLILEKIFGSCGAFNRLPFVRFCGDRQYKFCFEYLRCFAEQGHEKTVALIEVRRLEVARQQAEKSARQQAEEEQRKIAALAQRLGGKTVSPELSRQITKFADNKSLVVVDGDVALVVTGRNITSSAGVGYVDQVQCFYGSQSLMQEWQWRDCYSERNDRRYLQVYGLGEVKVFEKGTKVVVEVVLLNKDHGNRSATFEFTKLEPKVVTTPAPTLALDEQAIFSAKVEKESLRIMTELEHLWECKPQMAPDGPGQGYHAYARPALCQQVVRPEIGVAAFVTEEQIDHRVNLAQMRREVYVVKADGTVKCVAEDHSWGAASLTLSDVAHNEIVICLATGSQTIKI